jgi:hypothetical protein
VLAKRPNVDPNDAPSQTPWADKDDEILAQIRTTELPNPQLSALVNKAAVNAHETLEGFRVRVEGAFDDSMERASGWYKRKIQTMLLVLSAAVVIGLNVDTVRVGARSRCAPPSRRGPASWTARPKRSRTRSTTSARSTCRSAGATSAGATCRERSRAGSSRSPRSTSARRSGSTSSAGSGACAARASPSDRAP